MRGALVAVVVMVPLLGGCLGGGPIPEDEASLHDAVVVAQHYLASEAGAEILRQGGDAIDAAAAVQWALTVVEPQFSGLGGGAFLVHYDAQSGAITTLDGRETAPAAATPDQFQDPLNGQTQDATLTGIAVGVPGTLRLFDEALARWGTMTLAETMAPAIRLAEEGYPVTEKFSADIETYRARIEGSPAAAALFLPGSVCAPTQAGYSLVTSVPRCVGGSAPAPGSLIINADLAVTFRTIAENGPSAFYEGPIGEAVVAAVASRDGRMTMQDLRDYRIEERVPLASAWKGYDIFTMDMPSSALAMLQMLKMQEGDDLAAMGHNSADSLHLLLESMHLAYADRAAYMGDEAFVDVPQSGLLHPEYVAGRRALIDMAHSRQEVTAGDPWPYEEASEDKPTAAPADNDGHHTSHFVIVDHDGDVVSVTTTIEHYFGNGMMVPGHGFLLNNEMTDFDYTPGGPNQVEPGKRPRSSMSPTIVLQDGEPIMALGSPGGSRIIVAVFQALLNVLEFGMTPSEAVAAPRVFSSAPPTVRWDGELPSGVRADLESRGHVFEEAPRDVGSVQLALKTAHGWVGAADPRRDGSAVVVRAAQPSTIQPSS